MNVAILRVCRFAEATAFVKCLLFSPVSLDGMTSDEQGVLFVYLGPSLDFFGIFFRWLRTEYFI